MRVIEIATNASPICDPVRPATTPCHRVEPRDCRRRGRRPCKVALLLVDQLDLTGYYAFHATRADLLRRLGRYDQALVAYETAAALATSTAERNHLIARVETFREKARSTD